MWTFTLRQGVKWHDGSDFSSADVAATMDRLVVAANAGLAGVIAEGAVDTTDPNVAVFNLEGANGNFPYLVSVFNAQTLITPASYETGTTLDGTPNGTGPWKLTSYDPATGASFERNPDWWGGQTPLDGQEMQFFGDVGTMVTAMQGGAVDALVQFSVLGGDALAEQPRLHRARGAVLDAPPDLDALRHRPVRRQGRPPGARLHVRPRADDQHAVPGPRARSPTTTSSPRSCRSSTRRSRRSG